MLKIQKLAKKYSGNIIFENFDLNISPQEISCLLGVSGIGKTTLLNIISGILAFDNGDISDFTDKTFSFIFQEPRLLQWKTLLDNIIFILREKFKKEESLSIASKYLELVGLSSFRDYYPDRVSGGMQQRVSIARAFAYPSDILIMDEPFKSLDFKLKKGLMQAFIDLWENDRRTVIFVTHDIEEAACLGNKIFILNDSIPTSVKLTLDIPVTQKNRLADYNCIREIKKQLIENL
jgi:NitT/TauT family transport system ATP-binding protein